MVLLTKAGPYTNNEQKQNKMFSLFNKNKIEEQDFYFLKNVICILPTKWDFLIKQINSRFIIGKCVKINFMGRDSTTWFSIENTMTIVIINIQN